MRVPSSESEGVRLLSVVNWILLCFSPRSLTRRKGPATRDKKEINVPDKTMNSEDNLHQVGTVTNTCLHKPKCSVYFTHVLQPLVTRRESDKSTYRSMKNADGSIATDSETRASSSTSSALARRRVLSDASSAEDYVSIELPSLGPIGDNNTLAVALHKCKKYVLQLYLFLLKLVGCLLLCGVMLGDYRSAFPVGGSFV